jgi:hypothetical protein
MPYIMGQATVPASNTVAVFSVPASYCNVTFYNTNTAATNVYVGTSTLVSSSNGLICHSIPTSFSAFMGTKGATFYATTGGATPSSINYLIVTDF